MTEPLGRWLDTVTPANMPCGDLVWLPQAKGGIRSQVVTMSGRTFAVLRPIRRGPLSQWNVRVEGFVWFPAAMPEKSPARLMGIKESPVAGFTTVAEARAAVAEARRLLDEHLRRGSAS